MKGVKYLNFGYLDHWQVFDLTDSGNQTLVKMIFVGDVSYTLYKLANEWRFPVPTEKVMISYNNYSGSSTIQSMIR